MTNIADVDVTNEVTIDNTADALSLLSSSNNPDDSTLTVAESDTTDKVPALMFKLKAGSNSSDITLDTLPITVKIASAGATVTQSTDVIDSIVVTIGSKEVTADETNTTINNAGTDTATYTADFSGEDVVIGAGETIEVKVYITFAEQGGTGTSANYADGLTKVTASITGTAIMGESVNDDTIHPTTGTQTGAELTLSTTAATITVASSSKTATVSDTGTTGFIGYEFKVVADNGNVEIATTSGTNVNTNGTSDDIKFTMLPSTGLQTVAITLVSGNATYANGVWTIIDGDDATFALDFTITGAGTHRVRLDSIEGVTLDNLSAAISLNA